MTLSSPAKQPLVLCIMDGWGERTERKANAVAAANTPFWLGLREKWPLSLLEACGKHVGLPDGQMGNSEVGHMCIGAGRIMRQDLPRIDHAIETGELARSDKLNAAADSLLAAGGRLHLMGLVSPGGVHSHQNHMAWLAKWFKEKGVPVLVHAWLDGRDTAPRSAGGFMQDFLEAANHPTLASVTGRFYAMDRDQRWARTEVAFRAMVNGHAEVYAPDWQTALSQAYADGKDDEFVPPTVITPEQTQAGHSNPHEMRKGDGFLITNFRADRARQITHALIDPDFEPFERGPLYTNEPGFSACLTIGLYEDSLAPWTQVLFPPQIPQDTFAETISRAGLRQLRIAETEKYAHVTYFFNGGREEPFAGEERILVPSPKVETYDLKPEMSAESLTDQLLEAINENCPDVIIVNYANPDMVGHCGKMSAAIKAVETVDQCLSRLVPAVLARGGALLITADHGNADLMEDPETGEPHTAHTLSKVPFLLAGCEGLTVRDGTLADLAPTLLDMLGIEKPADMSGSSLIV